MDLLLVGDGSTYIDLSEAKGFDVGGVAYYRAENGVWVRKEPKNSLGQAIPELEAFKIFMSARMLADAEEYFPELYEKGFKVEVTTEPNASPADATTRHLWQFALGGLVGLALVAYVVATIMGRIPASRQISLGTVGIIAIVVVAIALLLRPQLVRNIQRFEFGTFKLELRDRLRELQDTQEDHSKNLGEIRFILEALVTSSEMSHLKTLAYGAPSNYKRNATLLAELRRLRAIGLIRPKGKIGQLPATFNLAKHAELTRRGSYYLSRVENTESPPGELTTPNGVSP